MYEKCGGSYKKLVDSAGRCCEEYLKDTTAIREYEKANEERRGFEYERLACAREMPTQEKARNGENVLELVRIRVCIKTLDPSECTPQLHFFYDISLSRFTTKTPLISP